MKRTLVLCSLAAVCGVLVSVALTTSQEPQPAPGVATEGQPPAGPGPVDPRAPRPMLAPVPPPRPETPPLPLDEYTPEERVNIAVYEKANRSVVNIATKAIRSDRMFPISVPSEGEGSGAVLDDRGHILTNYHVVEDAREIQVTLFNGKTYPARAVGHDANTDVAVLRIDAPAAELFPVVFGDSTRLRVGQRVYAIGNPFGFDRTLSTGIVSSLDRWIPSRRNARRIKQIIQIDAAINPGNSGGPLLDSHARMIGMNTAIASRSGDSAGVGFAIPVRTIARIVPQLIAHGKIVRADAGIAVVRPTTAGLAIENLVSGGAAERAGLRGPRILKRSERRGGMLLESYSIDRSAADVITAVDGQPVKTPADFLDLIENKQPGESVTLTVLRGGREANVRLQLDAGD